MRAEGSNGSVEFLADSIVIRRKGLANIITQGIQGDKTIPLSSITAVQFKEAGAWMAGMIQFSLLGGREFRGGMLEATKDENAVLFEKRQQADFVDIRDRIQAAIRQQSASPTSAVGGIADELSKLAELVEKGFLTRDEFERRKSTLLG